LSRNSLSDLELDHAAEGANAARRLQNVMQDRRGDVIRQVPENVSARCAEAAADLRNVNLQDIGRHHADGAVGRKLSLQPLRQSSVDFNRHHASRALRQQTGHGAAARTYFNHQIVGADVERRDDALPPGIARQKVLAQLGASLRSQANPSVREPRA
jgi:hypothetical protein